MIVKIEKIDNDFIVAIPNECMKKLKLHDGQEMEVNIKDNILIYTPIRTKSYINKNGELN